MMISIHNLPIQTILTPGQVDLILGQVKLEMYVPLGKVEF